MRQDSHFPGSRKARKPASSQLAAEELRDRLAKAGHPLTGARRVLLNLIAARPGTFNAADLGAAARQAGAVVGRATIFRTLELLTALGAIERLDLPGGEHAYILCATGHHHHVVCTGCGRSQDLDLADGGLAALIGAAAQTSGFALDHHRIELFGLCVACQRALINQPTGPLALTGKRP